jgi:hypothetical protein
MRLPAVIAAVMLLLLTGVVGNALAAPPSTVSHRQATPAPGNPCTLEAPTPGPAWLMPAYDAAIADDSTDESQYSCRIPPLDDVDSHEHSGWFFLFVESGTITFTVEEGIMWAYCAAGCGTSSPADPDGIATLLPGESVTLSDGDWVLQDHATTHLFSNVDTSNEAILRTAGGYSDLNGDGGCRGAC